MRARFASLPSDQDHASHARTADQERRQIGSDTESVSGSITDSRIV